MLVKFIALLPLLALRASASPVLLRGRQVVVDPDDPALASSISADIGVATPTTLSDSLVAPSATTSTATATSTSSNDVASASASAGVNGTVAVDNQTESDLTVIKFAALAEALESKFYEVALQKFTPQAFADFGFVDGQAIFDQLSVIQKDESTHLTVLQSAAGAFGGSTADLDTCTFNFDDATRDVAAFIATARVLEYVGVSAYIGGATLIESKGLLVSAAEILTVEARHNTLLNIFSGGSAVAAPFDMVLSPQQVLSLAAPFVSGGCNPVAALGLTPTPALTITNADTPVPGTLLTFGGAIEGQDQADMFCNMIVGGATTALSFPMSECRVPDGIDGLVYIFIIRGAEPLAANIIEQKPENIVAGPALAFIDTIPNAQSQLLLGQNPAVQHQAQQPPPAQAPPAHQVPPSHQPPAQYQPPAYQPPPSHQQPPSQHGQVKVITTTTIIEKMRQDHHVKTPVDGGVGGAVALGWL